MPGKKKNWEWKQFPCLLFDFTHSLRIALLHRLVVGTHSAGWSRPKHACLHKRVDQIKKIWKIKLTSISLSPPKIVLLTRNVTTHAARAMTIVRYAHHAIRPSIEKPRLMATASVNAKTNFMTITWTKSARYFIAGFLWFRGWVVAAYLRKSFETILRAILEGKILAVWLILVYYYPSMNFCLCANSLPPEDSKINLPFVYTFLWFLLFWYCSWLILKPCDNSCHQCMDTANYCTGCSSDRTYDSGVHTCSCQPQLFFDD